MSPTICCFLFICFVGVKMEVTTKVRLRETLLANYDKTARPKRQGNGTTILELGFIPTHILQLDEQRVELTVNGYLVMEWLDERLKWEPSQFGNLTKINLPTSRLWTPGIHLYRGFEDSLGTWDDSMVKVDRSGKTLFQPAVTFMIPCKLDYKYFPKDSGSCAFLLGSWRQRGGVLYLQTLDDKRFVVTGDEVTGGEWKLRSYEYEMIKHAVEEEYSWNFFKVNLTVERSNGNSRLATSALPFFSGVILTVAVFWLEIGGPARYVLALANYLLLQLRLLSSARTIPAGGNTPLMGQLEGVAVCLALIVTLETMLLDVLVRRAKFRAPPEFLSKITGAIPQKLLGFCPIPESDSQSGGWSSVLTALDRIIYYLLIISYVAVIATMFYI